MANSVTQLAFRFEEYGGAIRGPGKEENRTKKENERDDSRRLLGAGQVFLAVARLVTLFEDFHFKRTIGVSGAARVGIISEAVLRAQLFIDAVKNFVKFLRAIGKKHCATGRVGNGFEGVFTGGVAAILVFYRAHDYGVKQNSGASFVSAGGIKIGEA